MGCRLFQEGQMGSIVEGYPKRTDSWAHSKLNLEENEQDEKINTIDVKIYYQAK